METCRFDLIIMFFHYLWVGPVQTIAVTLLMYYEVRLFILNMFIFGAIKFQFQIGISAIAGVIFLLMFIPFQCKIIFLQNFLLL